MDRYGIGTEHDKGTEIFSFREPIVLLPIICLSMLDGIEGSIDQMQFIYHRDVYASDIRYYGIVHALAQFPSIIFMTFLSEFRGRKLNFIILFVLSVLSALLSFIPYQPSLVILKSFIVSSLKGGVLAMSALAICEYCSPKHRLACLIAHIVAGTVGGRVTSTLYTTEVLSEESSYLSLCVVVVGVGCCVSVRWWPESPYWLAARGRRAEARAALLRLRGEGAAARGELRALLASRRRPSPKVFWLALLIALITISVAAASIAIEQILILLRYYMFDRVVSELLHQIIITCGGLFVCLIIVVISYTVKRKVVYTSTAVIPIVMLYILSITMWIYTEHLVMELPVLLYGALVTCSIIFECTHCLSLALFMEFIPQKYYTYLSSISCMYFLISSRFLYFVPMILSHAFPLHGSLIILATLALLGVALLYWLSPDTRNQNLFEIEKLFISRFYTDNPEQDQVVLEDRTT